MSWNPIEEADEIELRLVMEESRLFIKWTCPRCELRQAHPITLLDLRRGSREIACQNVGVCGERQSYFELDALRPRGSFKGLLDRPLEPPAVERLDD